MNIYDNIGCSFEVNNNQIILTGPLNGYSVLDASHVGSVVPYLARNLHNNNIVFEVGVGEIAKDGLALVLKNRKVSASSNNNELVDFSGPGNKQFYLFVNSANYNTAFNNVVVKNSNFNVQNNKTAYIVDFSVNQYVIAKLPNPVDHTNLEVEFRTVGDGSLIIRSQTKDFSLILSGANRYTKLVSTGEAWIELKDSPEQAVSAQSSEFSTLSDPVGDDFSFQYKSSGNFEGSDLFWDPTAQSLLFGDVDSEDAKNIIPSSGHYPVIFNQTRDGSDFIVYGTGNSPGYPEKNLYFTSTGKLGINMPSGLKPSTVLHIVNTLCREGMRLENWGSCFPADITLYQNGLDTPTDANNNSSFAQITFAAKNASNVKRNFAQIVAKRKSVSSSKGELQVLVGDSSSPSNSGTVTITTNPDQTTINHGTGSLSVTSNDTRLTLGSSYVGVGSNKINIDAGATTNNINITGVVNVSNRLKLNYITQTNSLLSIDSNNAVIAATGFQIPGIHDSFWPYEPRDNANKIGGKDVTWERYRPKAISVDSLCLNAKVNEFNLSETAETSEFVTGDQIAIYNANNNTTQYRKINQVLVSGDAIAGMTIDQSITLSGTLSVYSVTRGGVLNNTIHTTGTISDATSVTISTRPSVPTIFNTKQKNIDFLVYGTENTPALGILANASLEDKASGIYYGFATQSLDYAGDDIVPFASRIGSNGYGINNSANNAVNFREAADTGIWANRVTAVGTNGRPSYYGTYDQNGNVYEWIEDSVTNGSLSSYQYVCGGSWRTFFADGLRSYIPTPRTSGLDDIGFRVASQAGFSNDTIELNLGLKFVRVDDVNNPSDNGYLYTEDFDNRFGINSEPSPITVNNLGVVNHSYNISSFEVTNSQYATFLNSVATGVYPDSLYDSRMSSNNIGGITQSGDGISTPFSYTVKGGMGAMPVVFVNYLSAIRFINWLSNGAISGDDAVDTLEYGSYSIEGIAQSITKNKNKGYYLPSVHEWHKSAYYIPVSETLLSPKTAVTIRSNVPYEYASGQISSLTVSGNIYADTLNIGNSGNALLSTNIVSGQYFNILLGPDNAVSDINETTAVETQYRSYISNTGIQLATTGNINLVSKINPISIASFTPSGIFVSSQIIIATLKSDGTFGSGISLTPSGLEVLDASGVALPGGSTPGPNGGFVYKGLSDNNLYSSSSLYVEEFVSSAGTGYYPKISGTTNNAVIYNNINGYLSSSGFFTVGVAPEGAVIDDPQNKIVSVFTSDTGIKPATFCTNRILIGPVLESFKGSLLQHNGLEPATWTENDFFKADGVSWTRLGKRAVKLIGPNEIQFVNLGSSDGGTGDVSADEIESEFAFTDTIALYNIDREVYYVKVAKTVLVDNLESYGTEESLWDTETNRTNKIFRVVPPIPEAWLDDGNKVDTIGLGSIWLGYAFSVQKGAYFSMSIEPSAIKAFDNEAAYTDESSLPYPITRFKPGTTNTISIRPNISTTFNTLAEDIDFAIYGHRKTLLNRYEPEWFTKDDTGLPVGLLPAFKINAHIPNSVLGSLESGVFRDTLATTDNGQVASGVYLDLNSKLTINMLSPYQMSSLTGVKLGLVKYDSDTETNRAREKEYGFDIPNGGAIISGTLDLAQYADLSVGGTTYSSGLIVNQLALSPLYTGVVPVPYELSLVERLYIPNYPLTINSYGQVVSLVPPPAPTVPDAPVSVSGQSKNTSIVLTWDVPLNNGGSNILSYIVEYSSNLGTTWTIFDQLDSNNLPAHPDKNTTRTITNLINDTSYVFRVYAINTVGKGSYSDVSDPIAPMNLTPTEPRAVQVDDDNSGSIRGSINPTVSWTAPLSIPADRSITGYDIYYFIDELDANGQVVSYDKATWINAGNTASLSKQVLNIPIDKYVVFGVVAILDTDIGGGVESPKGIYRSPGTGVDPRDPTTEEPTQDTDYNFGTILFTGSC